MTMKVTKIMSNLLREAEAGPQGKVQTVSPRIIQPLLRQI